jgi:hypothetical protein
VFGEKIKRSVFRIIWRQHILLSTSSSWRGLLDTILYSFQKASAAPTTRERERERVVVLNATQQLFSYIVPVRFTAFLLKKKNRQWLPQN